MREPRPDWSPLGVNFKILDEHPYLFYISSSPPGNILRRVILLMLVLVLPGGYSINFWVGMCRWDAETLSLY